MALWPTLLLWAAAVSAAPQLNSVFGEFTQGGAIQLLGSGFGAHGFEVEWTGDWLEQQEVGSNPDRRERWQHLFESFARVDSISDRRAWSGQRAICTSVDRADPACGAYGCFESTLQYVHPQEFRRIWASWWIYFEPLVLDPKAETQWKFVRLNSNFTGWSELLQRKITPVNNPQSDVYWPLYVDPAGAYSRSYVEISCNQDCPGAHWEDCFEKAQPRGFAKSDQAWDWIAVDGGVGDLSQHAPTIGGWCRVELFADSGSMDGDNGMLRLCLRKPGVGAFTGYDWEGIRFLQSQACRNQASGWRTLIFQNFFDSNGSEPGVERANIWMDDIYLQFGGQARVELGDRAEHEECTQLEIQPIESWADGEIRVRAHRGGFRASGTAYVFVVDADGRPSHGMPVRLP